MKKRSVHVTKNINICDLLYYAVYCFVNSIPRQNYLWARTWAVVMMPYFFAAHGMFLYFIITHVTGTKMIPSSGFVPFLVFSLFFVWFCTSNIYESKGRADMIASVLDKVKNRKLYAWMGGMLVFESLSLPILTVIFFDLFMSVM